MTVLLIALGAAIGAPARYLADRTIQSHHETVFPWGTLAVNVAASFVLGVLTGAAGSIDPDLNAALGTGLCGALSTYSTFSYETVRLLQTRARFYAFANVGISLAAGIGAAAFGWSLGAAFT
ncbi:MAG TPA: fluoride efflux transporter CrcB [Mycobacteriales bacterium]|nr:fluoride efflux transporter CrcB [Mycobacteriales bacterium]